MRILIIGHPGAGKTYLSDKLSDRLGIVKIAIDVLFDKHPFYLLSRRLYRKALSKLMGDNTDWVIDGYHTGRMPDELVRQADMVIYLSLPQAKLERNVLSRYRIKKADKDFSHWQSTRINYLKNLAQIRLGDKALKSDVDKLRDFIGDNVRFVELRSREEIDTFILSL